MSAAATTETQILFAFDFMGVVVIVEMAATRNDVADVLPIFIVFVDARVADS